MRKLAKPRNRNRLGDRRPLSHDDVRASLEPPGEFRQMLGLVSEVGLHHDHGVAPGILRASARLAREFVERMGVTHSLLTTDHRDRGDLGIRGDSLRRPVGATVVVNEDLILARVALEHLSDAPEEDADGGSLVVSRNADIEQFVFCLLLEWAVAR